MKKFKYKFKDFCWFNRIFSNRMKHPIHFARIYSSVYTCVLKYLYFFRTYGQFRVKTER